eukprot:gb/GECG01000635.1/.p1 GENE.gb/GECG01000635.1/~~gb/GECG01000635.1/.p1  ORF type:complete len:616 (+),score=74.62 gb/GECG01000635.1/:1-1848(+)
MSSTAAKNKRARRRTDSSTTTAGTDSLRANDTNTDGSARPQKKTKTNDQNVTSAIVHHLEKSDQPPAVPASEEGEDILESFAYPFGARGFMKHVYRRHCLAIQNGGVERIRGVCERYLHNLNIEKLVHDSPSEKIFAWLKPKETNKAQQRLDSIALDNPDHALTCYDAGASLYFRAPQEMADEFIPALSRAIGLEFGAFYQSPYVSVTEEEGTVELQDVTDSQPKGEIETFVARAGHVTDWHIDFMENFTIQLQGSKRWYLKRGNLTHVLRGATPHYKPDDNVEQQIMLHRMQDSSFQFHNPQGFFDPSRQDVECVVLHPGDILYFPAGTWHRVECVEDSISVNLSLVGTHWADIASNCVRQYLWRNDIFRSLICINEYCKESIQKPLKLERDLTWDSHDDDGNRKENHLLKTREILQRGCDQALQSMGEILRPEVLLPRAALLPRIAAIDCSNDRMLEILSELYGSTHSEKCQNWPDRLILHPNATIVPRESIPQAKAASLEDEESEAADPEETPPGMKGYLVFVNMGNDDIQPMVRLTLHVSEKQAECMGSLCARCAGQMSDVHRMEVSATDLTNAPEDASKLSFSSLSQDVRQLIAILMKLDILLWPKSSVS